MAGLKDRFWSAVHASFALAPLLLGVATAQGVVTGPATAADGYPAISNAGAAALLAVQAQQNSATYETQSAHNSSVATVQAAIPSTCTSAPAADTFGGTVGVMAPCAPRADAAAPTLVQPSSASTTSGGTFSGTWPIPFPRNPTTVIAQANNVSGPYICQATGTTTGYTGACWQVVSTTLPNTVTAITSLVVSPVQNPAAGLSVSVVGRQ